MRKPFHLNVERNDNQSGSIICGDKMVCLHESPQFSLVFHEHTMYCGIT